MNFKFKSPSTIEKSKDVCIEDILKVEDDLMMDSPLS